MDEERPHGLYCQFQDIMKCRTEGGTMRGMERIREEVVRTSDEPWLEEFFHRYSLKKEPYAYCLYVERGGQRELALGFLFSDPAPAGFGPISGFARHLESIRPEGFWDLVFALDTYSYLRPKVVRFRSEKAEPELGPEMSAVLEPLLAGSRGFIVWHFQLEHIIGLFDARAEHCRKLRQDLNAKRPNAEAWMGQREIEPGLSLYDFVVSRMMIAGTMVPGLEGALILFRALDVAV